MKYFKSTSEIALDLSQRCKAKRISHDLTQKELAERSGVSFGSVKRFEQSGDISLKHLLLIAFVLDELESFNTLFSANETQSMDEFITNQSKATKKRVRK